MRVAYISRSNMASTFRLATMILPQLEGGFRCAEVDGTFFFDDNTLCLRSGVPVGECMAKVASEHETLLMMCDECAVRRNLAEGALEQCGKGEVTVKGTVEGATAGCFPQLFDALSNPPDQIIIHLGCHRRMHGDHSHSDPGYRLDPEDPTQCIPERTRRELR